MIADLSARAVAADLAVRDHNDRVRVEASAEAYAFAWLSGGAPTGSLPTVSALARALDISRPVLYAWLTATPERKARLLIAREESAGAMIDDGLQLLDDASPTESGLAQARANFRKWLAGVYDRQTFGTAQAPALSISVGHLHLQAFEALKVGRPTELGTLPHSLPVERLAETHSDVSVVEHPILLSDNDLLPEELL